ncbi:MAG: acyltransferase family protein [Arcanobacterium sp.]|nr:acyltransferase family protein [Arcanobacterium sp.]
MNKPAQHGNRIDALDGIRTVAVFLVIAFHVSTPRMSAGYIGVDMFFVLSGYLITTGLVRDVEIYGRPRLARFWSRRFKRLLPAALLTIVAVAIWAKFFAPLYRRPDLGTDIWWTIFYLANWRFVGSASYFESDGTRSPLLHMWSLAVEEQFYFFWPLIITAIAILVYTLHRSSAAASSATTADASTTLPSLRRRVLVGMFVAALVVIGVSSALLGYDYAAISENRAYMGTDAKAFEPMVGALLAIAVHQPTVAAFVTRHARKLIWGSGVLMVILFATLDGPPPAYYRGAALLFALSTGAFIVGIAHNLNGFEARILAWAPVSYLGRISYGLYLWHWPWAVWLLDPAHGFEPARALLVVALTIGTASLSYHVLEMPIRQGRLSAALPPRRAIAASFTTMIVVAIAISPLGGTPISGVTQNLQNIITGKKPSTVDPSVMLVVGDSVPKRLTPVLAPIAQKRGLNVVSAARGSCTPMGIHMQFYDAHDTGRLCPEAIAIQTDLMERYHPGIVLWWSRYEVIDRYTSSGELLKPTTEEFWQAQQRDFEAAAQRFTAHGATLVVVLTERPGQGMLTRDKATLNAPLIQNMIYHDEFRQRFNRIVADYAATHSSVRTISGDSLFCPESALPAAGKESGTSLCNDAVPAKGYIRPDGSHVNNDLFGTQVSNQLLNSIDAVLRR